MPVNSFENYYMSWKPERSKLRTPFYRSIASFLEYDIINGYLKPDTKLPPQRELADFLDVNLSTITRAFKICEMKGLIYAVTGRGTFVASGAEFAITKAERDENSPIIEMGIVEPLDTCNDVVAETIKNIVRKDYLEKLLDYSNPLGMPYHRMAAKQWMNHFNMDEKIENISITSGGQNSLSLILMSLFNPGDKIAVDKYTYPNFIELASMLNISLIPIESDIFGMSAEVLEMVCKASGIQGIYLVPSCSNPTAITMSMERREQIAYVINSYNLILVEDDIFSFLAPEHYLPVSHYVPDHYVYSLSISKSLSSGLRVGFIAYAERFAEKIKHGIYNINIKTSSLNAEIITELINSGSAFDIIRKKKQIAEERNAIYKNYFEVNKNENPLSFFRWLPIEKKYDSFYFEKNAIEKGVHVYHSDRFSVKKEDSQAYIRISLTSVKNTEELEMGLKILKEAVVKDL
ncbi:PLP-dependent aminotransferase family protein [Niallia sp. NCCP-28]|uniref:aminotransferase-like domain-containing protein n=1 Tax=Niallia sp. NCCP-28 TaxID=2934712 RepID=UPI0020871920|nr:PLP-dependent aminotransferase family protein [Niallia sp. NCCP-28]GKU85154.1 GntR family transcriptional regulator [Niallia sp. NCCP-28]